MFQPAVTAGNSSIEAAGATTGEPENSKEHNTEIEFTIISVVTALCGFGLAWFLYYKNPEMPARIATSLNGLYTTVAHKYYVDEIYAAFFVKPLIKGSTEILWHGVDQNIIDAALDGSADGALQTSDAARHMQSGNIRSYAGWISAGAGVVIAFMIWMWMEAR